MPRAFVSALENATSVWSSTEARLQTASGEGDLFVAKIREALAALTEAEAILRATFPRGLGRYRPIGVAEKRAQIEAAGEEWPIGDDGLPKVWSASATHRGGGFWARRSSVREYQRRRHGRTTAE